MKIHKKLKIINNILRIYKFNTEAYDLIKLPIICNISPQKLKPDSVTKVIARIELSSSMSILFSYTGFWFISKKQNVQYVHGEDEYKDLEQKLFIDSISGEYEIDYQDLKNIYEIWEKIKSEYTVDSTFSK